jgi:uncharacterized membrane protein
VRWEGPIGGYAPAGISRRREGGREREREREGGGGGGIGVASVFGKVIHEPINLLPKGFSSGGQNLSRRKDVAEASSVNDSAVRATLGYCEVYC